MSLKIGKMVKTPVYLTKAIQLNFVEQDKLSNLKNEIKSRKRLINNIKTNKWNCGLRVSKMLKKPLDQMIKTIE